MKRLRITAPSRDTGHRAVLRPVIDRLGVATAVLGVLLVVAGCTGASEKQNAADTVRRLGSVPIASGDSGLPTPIAGAGHQQLVAMGNPIRAQLPETTAIIVAQGPAQDAPDRPGEAPDRISGTITVTASVDSGQLLFQASDFSSRDETGTAIPLTPRGPAAVTASPGHPATLTLVGSYQDGAAQLTWCHGGEGPIALWVFNIELN